jgi:hypothetical protein
MMTISFPRIGKTKVDFMNIWNYSFTNNLYWVNDRNGVVVVDEQHQQSYLLGSSESILWRLLIIHIDSDAIIRRFSAIISVSEDEGKGKILSILSKWEKNNLVEHGND